ncbi:transcriptional regulator, partial [Candidatus Gottesmanbacteria bacterium]|nr:transcriptional regulator [Candidatus Gottesmanbacteria bacterium]
MLEDLIISRVRVKILTLFLSHPGVIFHVRDIVRKIGEEINAVRRELSHME